MHNTYSNKPFVLTTGRGLAFAAALLVASPCVFAAGKPPPSYPEQLEGSHDCATLQAKTAKQSGWFKAEGPLARLDFLRARHRAAQRYRQTRCGDGDEHGFELSHRAQRSGKVMAHTDDHGDKDSHNDGH